MEALSSKDDNEIKELKREIKALKSKLGNYALAISLLKEVDEKLSNKVKGTVWMETRWLPGLELLRIGRQK